MPDMSRLPDYKGFEIWVNSYGTFFGKSADGEKDAEADTLYQLHEMLDKISKKSIRKEVYVNTYSGLFKGIMTSVKENRGTYYKDDRYDVKVSVDGRSSTYHQ